MPTSIITKTTSKQKKINELLNWKKSGEKKALNNAFGLLKNIKKTPVAYQRALRREK